MQPSFGYNSLPYGNEEQLMVCVSFISKICKVYWYKLIILDKTTLINAYRGATVQCRNVLPLLRIACYK